MVTYNVYLDGVLINEYPGGLDELVLTIEREDGFGNSEQILRESMSTQLEFSGDGQNIYAIKGSRIFAKKYYAALSRSVIVAIRL